MTLDRLRHTLLLVLAPAFVVSASAALCAPTSTSPQDALPRPLVFVRDIDKTILQDMRYATEDNFTGRRVPGYASGECVLDVRAAQALARVQAKLRSQKLSLKMYDCYRPLRAVRFFVEWANGRRSPDGLKRFFPRLERQQLVPLGYIAPNSNHARGIAVDLTVVQLPPRATATFDAAKPYGACNGPAERRAPDNGVDMGTGFDCFDAQSHIHGSRISNAQRQWRELLRTAMADEGFRNYELEWWHFTFETQPTNRPFDIDVPAYRVK